MEGRMEHTEMGRDGHFYRPRMWEIVKEHRKEQRKEGRKDGRKEGNKEGWNVRKWVGAAIFIGQ